MDFVCCGVRMVGCMIKSFNHMPKLHQRFVGGVHRVPKKCGLVFIHFLGSEIYLQNEIDVTANGNAGVRAHHRWPLDGAVRACVRACQLYRYSQPKKSTTTPSTTNVIYEPQQIPRMNKLTISGNVIQLLFFHNIGNNLCVKEIKSSQYCR
jgi:hypothetical protein